MSRWELQEATLQGAGSLSPTCVSKGVRTAAGVAVVHSAVNAFFAALMVGRWAEANAAVSGVTNNGTAKSTRVCQQRYSKGPLEERSQKPRGRKRRQPSS